MQVVIPIALLSLLWRRWRFFAGFALSTCLLSLISLWVVGFAQTAAYARSLLSVGTNMPAALQFPLRVSIMANLRGLFFGLLGDRLPAFWIQVLTIVTSVFVLLWVAFAIRGKQRRADAFVLAITASLIVSYYLFIHDLSVLLIPIVVTLDRFILAGAERPAITLDRAAGWMSATLLIAPLCIFLIPDHFYLVALPLCAFMVILIRGFPREPQALGSARHA
jgi:hypothetical protein